MAVMGMIILSPDALLLRLIDHASFSDVLFYRSIFTFLALLGYLLVRHRTRLIKIFLEIGRPGLITTVLMTGSSISFVGAITLTSVANALVILATMPFFGAVLGWLILGETVKPRTRNSIILAVIGIVVIFSGSLGGGYWIGDLLALMTAFLQGLNLVILRQHKGRDVLTPSLCLSGLFVALLVLPMANPGQTQQGDLQVLMIMGLVIIPVAMVLFLGGARHAPAAEIALLSLIETVLGPLWVWLVVGEVAGTLTLIGGAIVILAVGGNAWFGVQAHRQRAFAQ